MGRFASLLAGIAGLVFVPAASAAIPLFNGTCPGGIDVHADAGGPIYVNGRETSLKRFSDQYFEARDATSRVTLSLSLSADGSPSLSYTGEGGRNGVCQLQGQADEVAPSAAHRQKHEDHDDRAEEDLPERVTCESQDRQQTSCPMNTRGAVEVERQLSSTRCVEGQTWGLSRHAVWVSEGCRAIFRNVSAPARVAPAGKGSALAACNARKGGQGTLVTQLPVGTTHTEVIADYADGRYLCMVSNEGEVSSLTALRRR